MDASELFWNAPLEEMKRGYSEGADGFICLLCGHQAEKGVVYLEGGALYEAERFMRVHIARAHQSVFHFLVGLDKRLSGLTAHQADLLRHFFAGKSDGEVQEAMGIGSPSTIRNHRFALKERERQARVFLALMELLREKDAHAPAFISPHRTARMVDERYNVTGEEREKILRKHFPQGTDGPLPQFHLLQEKHKLVVLREIATRFEAGRTYGEAEVNRILSAVNADEHVIIRRYLIEYGLLDRKADGSEYWVKG